MSSAEILYIQLTTSTSYHNNNFRFPSHVLEVVGRQRIKDIEKFTRLDQPELETEIKRVFLVKEAFSLISASERKRNRKL